MTIGCAPSERLTSMYVPGSTLSMLKGHFVQDAHKVSIALCDVASLGGQVGAQKAYGTAKAEEVDLARRHTLIHVAGGATRA